MLPVVVLVPVAWLLGTFPTAVIVARAHGHDVTREGSGNPGASNVARLVGWRAGALVLVLDFAKGAIAAGVGYAVGGRPGAIVLGLAVVWFVVARLLHKASLASLLGVVLFWIAAVIMDYALWEIVLLSAL